MTDKVVVLVTCESPAEAERIAENVVGGKLAACVNVMKGVRSCYVWEGKLTWSDEVLLIVKTTKGRFPELDARIRELHSYSVAEVIAMPIEAGSEKYLKWIEEAV